PGLERALDLFRAAGEVESADPIAIVPAEAIPNDSLWSRASCFYQASRHDIHAPEAWDITTGDTSIVVGVIDTGVLMSHPDLAGHGTAVAGVVAALTDNRAGVAGTAWHARIMPLRIGWADVTGAELDLSFAAQAIRYATRMGATVLNLSFATTNQPDLQAAVT